MERFMKYGWATCIFLYQIFRPFLCAFRRAHRSQILLLRVLEDLLTALDKHLYIALMGLSKEFDSLSHDMLLDKFSPLGVSTQSVVLVSHARQLNIVTNLGKHLLFKVFINDIFLLVNKNVLYNYADDSPDLN